MHDPLTVASEETDPWLTVVEVADEFRVSKMTVYRMAASGELASVRFGRSYRIRRSAVDALVAESGAQR